MFICTDIEGTDNDLFAGHTFENTLVSGELFFLGWEVIAFEVQKLTAEQTNAAGIVSEYRTDTVNTADISEYIDFSAVDSNIFLTFEFLKEFLFAEILSLFSEHSGLSIAVGVDEDSTGVTVNDDRITVIY